MAHDISRVLYSSAVTIPSSGGESIEIVVPIPVAEYLHREQESAQAITDPRSELVQRYRAWETRFEHPEDWDDRIPRHCFPEPEGIEQKQNPGLSNWVLEHFSDDDFPLAADEERENLARHTLLSWNTYLDWAIVDLASSTNNDAIDFYWCYFVRLLVIDERLRALTGQNSVVEQHRDLIQDHISILIEKIRQAHEFGQMLADDPAEEMKRRLIALAQHSTFLRPTIAGVLTNWTGLADSGHALAEEIFFDVGEDTHREPGLMERLNQQAELVEKLQYSELAMTPTTADDPAWHHPLEYLGGVAEGKYLINIEEPCRSKNEEFSNSQQFQFALLEQVSPNGFTHWLFPGADRYLSGIHRWLNDRGDARSIMTLQSQLQEYMNLSRGQSVPPLRVFLLLPTGCEEPLEVTQELRYWERIWDLKEHEKATVSTDMVLLDDGAPEAYLNSLSPSAQKKYVCIGGILQREIAELGIVPRDQSLILRHHQTSPEYPRDTYIAHVAAQYVASEVGRKRGWGIHQSSVLPLKGNSSFFSTLRQGGIMECEWRLAYGFGKEDDYYDALCFTAEPEEEPEQNWVAPSEVDTGEPLVGAGGKKGGRK
jgi:hypothetical protein